MDETVRPQLPDIESALRLFDETTAALSARIQRLEAVLLLKQQQLVAANERLAQQAEEADRLSAYLDLVLGAVASGVVAVDGEGRVTTANAAAGEALKSVVPSLIGADYRALFPHSPLLRLLDGSEAVGAYERILRLPDGTRRILAAKASPLTGRDGRLLGAVEVFEDVTEMRRLQEGLDRADRLQQLGEMAAGVAHEIRNPLNGIEGFASLLQRDLPEGDPRRRYATLVVEGVRALNRTVSGMLEFTRPRRLDRRPTDARGLVDDVIALVESELEQVDGPRPTLTVDDRWNGDRILVDGLQLKQVLLNLVQNAVHALRDRARADDDDDRGDDQHPDGGRGGTVRVTLEATTDEEEPGIAITVDDDGPGVPVEARQRIFTPFYTTKDHGTGLGLAVSYTIVDLHGGALTVDDAPLGGARFRIAIPH